jgi:hypothetical protein
VAFQSGARWYTRQELVELVALDDHQITRRLIADWVAIGLLDKGTPRGRGRGKGKTYLWPENQAQLLRLLLDKRREASRSTLCNLPVALWLIWGDAFAPLRQVRRALRTWAKGWTTVSGGRADQAAQEVLEQFDHPDAKPQDREEVSQLVAKAAYTGEFDDEFLAKALARIADPNGLGLVRGPLGLGSTEDYVQMVLARLHAVGQLEQAPSEMFVKARDAYRMIGPLTDPENTKIDVEGNLVSLEELGARQASFEEAMNRACIDLITLLGLELSRHSQGAD